MKGAIDFYILKNGAVKVRRTNREALWFLLSLNEAIEFETPAGEKGLAYYEKLDKSIRVAIYLK